MNVLQEIGLIVSILGAIGTPAFFLFRAILNAHIDARVDARIAPQIDMHVRNSIAPVQIEMMRVTTEVRQVLERND